MPVKETLIKTKIIDALEKFTWQPVFYTDEFLETSVFDLAFIPAQGAFLPYQFVGYFTDGSEFKKWFFSNAMRHEEMQQAIEQGFGKKFECVYGQIYFNEFSVEDGSLIFDRLILHSSLPDKEAVETLKSLIKPNHLSNDFTVMIGQKKVA